MNIDYYTDQIIEESPVFKRLNKARKTTRLQWQLQQPGALKKYDTIFKMAQSIRRNHYKYLLPLYINMYESLKEGKEMAKKRANERSEIEINKLLKQYQVSRINFDAFAKKQAIMMASKTPEQKQAIIDAIRNAIDNFEFEPDEDGDGSIGEEVERVIEEVTEELEQQDDQIEIESVSDISSSPHEGVILDFDEFNSSSSDEEKRQKEIDKLKKISPGKLPKTPRQSEIKTPITPFEEKSESSSTDGEDGDEEIEIVTEEIEEESEEESEDEDLIHEKQQNAMNFFASNEYKFDNFPEDLESVPKDQKGVISFLTPELRDLGLRNLEKIKNSEEIIKDVIESFDEEDVGLIKASFGGFLTLKDILFSPVGDINLLRSDDEFQTIKAIQKQTLKLNPDWLFDHKAFLKAFEERTGLTLKKKEPKSLNNVFESFYLFVENLRDNMSTLEEFKLNDEYDINSANEINKILLELKDDVERLAKIDRSFSKHREGSKEPTDNIQTLQYFIEQVIDPIIPYFTKQEYEIFEKTLEDTKKLLGEKKPKTKIKSKEEKKEIKTKYSTPIKPGSRIHSLPASSEDPRTPSPKTPSQGAQR